MLRTSQEIIAELSQLYYDAKKSVIWEYSGTIGKDLHELRQQVNGIRAEVGLEPLAHDEYDAHYEDYEG